MKGWREQQAGPQEARTRDEFTAYGQAARAFVVHILEICARHHAKTFAALVSTDAPRAAEPSGYLLRDVINKLNGIHFTSSDELHTLGALLPALLDRAFKGEL